MVGWVTLSSASATEADLASLDVPGREKLVGVRALHRWEPDGEILSTAHVVDSCQVLAEHGLTLDLFFTGYTELPVAVSLAERAPYLPLIIDHLGRPPIGVDGAFAA